MLTACSDAPRALELSLAGNGEWVVRGVGQNGVVAMQMRSDAVPDARARTRVPRIGLMRDTIERIEAQAIRLKLDTATLDVMHVDGLYFSVTGPQLVRSPVDANRYVIEYADAIWLFAAPDTVIKLTNDEDVAELRGRQREGEVILYWSTNPLWSADGRHVAFITNRESLRGGTETQSIWVIDVAKRQQAPLVVLPSAAARAEGVLGENFLYTSTHVSGILAVNPETAEGRELSRGFLLSSHPRGKAAVFAVDEPDGRAVWVHGWRQDALRLSSPGDSFSWATQAQFSPAGDRLALVATDGAALYRLFVFFDGVTPPLSLDLPGGPTTGPVWNSESSLIFSSAKTGEPIRTWVMRLK